MKISVVTPCLDAARTIGETIESVVSQRGDFAIEYLLVDGGSSDGTVPLIEGYAGRVRDEAFPADRGRISLRWISEKDGGLYDALAKGFRLVTGDVVAYINADDFYLPHALSTVADVFRAFPDVRWLTGMTVKYNEAGQITEARMPLGYGRRMIRKGFHGTTLPFIQQESTFFRRDLLAGVDLDRLRAYRQAGDFFLWHAFAGSTDLYVVESCLAGFRCRPGQLSGNRGSYLREFSGIADRSGLADRMVAWLLRRADRFLTDPRKRRWNGKIISWRGTCWSMSR